MQKHDDVGIASTGEKIESDGKNIFFCLLEPIFTVVSPKSSLKCQLLSIALNEEEISVRRDEVPIIFGKTVT